MKPSVCTYIEMNGKVFRQKKQRESMRFPAKPMSTSGLTKALTVSIDWIIMTQDKFAFDMSVEIEEMKDES